MVTPGRIRLPIASLGSPAATLCDALLLRALDLIEQECPTLSAQLFGVPSLSTVLRASNGHVLDHPRLTFTHNEPAINLYSAGGDFAPHKDLQALTVLIPLLGADSFEGGGTAFWPRRSCEDGTSGLGTLSHDVLSNVPAAVLAPPAGTALLFSGEATHAGRAVTSGRRCVFVASFSLRDAGGTLSSTVPTDLGEEELCRLEQTVFHQMYHS